MTRSHYKLLEELQKELETSAKEVLAWYHNNVERVYRVELLEFESYSSEDDDKLWFEGWDDGCEAEGLQKLLPKEMLFFTDQERKEYADNFHADLKQKHLEERKKKEAAKWLQEECNLNYRKEQYEKLKKEFGNG